MASDSPADPTAERMISLAREHLAGRLRVTAAQIALVAADPVQWRDAGLGCPKPGVDYLPVPTPGYRIVLQVDGVTYEYHANQGNRVILCGT